MEPDAIQFDELVPLVDGVDAGDNKNGDWINFCCGIPEGDKWVAVHDHRSRHVEDSAMPQSGRQTRINIDVNADSLPRAIETAVENMRRFAQSVGIPQAHPPKKPASNIKMVGPPRKRKITLEQPNA